MVLGMAQAAVRTGVLTSGEEDGGNILRVVLGDGTPRPAPDSVSRTVAQSWLWLDLTS